RARGGGDLDVW
nr:immunoglobulin heavy chain junction region [Macaca mulatta]